MRARSTKRGDGYDITHLTCGLSRCDIVTADSGMAQLVRNHNLSAADCRLFGFREMPAFHEAVEGALADVEGV